MDQPYHPRIVADRERVQMDITGVAIDIRDAHERLRSDEYHSVEDLVALARRLDLVLLDGLDGAWSELFDAWLMAEREDAEAARVTVLRMLATDPEIPGIAAQKWRRLWREA